MGHDPLDAYSRELSLASEAYPASFKFGVPDQLEFFGDTLAEAAYQAAVQRLQDMGGTAVQLDFAPFKQAAQRLYGSAGG